MTASTVLRGEDLAFYVNVAAAGCTPSYSPMALQKGMSNNRSASKIDTSSKETGAWATFIMGRLEEGYSVNGWIPNEEDVKYEAVKAAFENRTSILVRTYDNTTPVESGVAYVTTFNRSYPDNDGAGYDCEFAISGGMKEIA